MSRRNVAMFVDQVSHLAKENGIARHWFGQREVLIVATLQAV